MKIYDLTPLFRSSVGYDSMFQLLNAAMRSEEAHASYPPYNIEKISDQRYRLVMAVAGFSNDDIFITRQNFVLTVAGKAKTEDSSIQYIHRGIARRAFERHFQLADYIHVEHASLEDGLLKITLYRNVPNEGESPRKIEIKTPQDLK
ncbi:MAG: Hsp20 family protein [Caedimonadaceae bacterium]|nr:MAG: Hsp20 family protein [Caedimonadaceae bacterium]